MPVRVVSALQDAPHLLCYQYVQCFPACCLFQAGTQLSIIIERLIGADEALGIDKALAHGHNWIGPLSRFAEGLHVYEIHMHINEVINAAGPSDINQYLK